MKKLYKYGAFLPLLFAAIGAKELILRQFWFDEALTLLNFALLPAEKIYTSYAIPNNHILYTYLLHWHYLFAPAWIAEDIWCRLLSLVIAFGYLIFSWWSIKKRAHRILLCIFAASLPFALYATSVRGYIAALFFAAVTLHTACVFAGKGNVRSGLFYLLSSLGCVAVLPSNIAVCAATVIYAAPLCGKRFFAGKRFVFLSIIPIGAFVLFWLPIYPQLYAASKLGEGWHNHLHVLGAISATFFSLYIIPLLCCLALFSLRRKLHVRDIRLAVFLIVVPLVFCVKVAPFPRVFFPFAAVFTAVVAQYFEIVLAFIRKTWKRNYKTVWSIIAVAGIVCTVVVNWTPACRSLLNQTNGGEADDYFTPWYVKAEHNPKAAAEKLIKLNYPLCYMSFNSDPWSVMFYSALGGNDLSKFTFDGPRGKVGSLPHNAVIVINVKEDAGEIEKRFQGVCIELWRSSHHKILRFIAR